jgi:hypothetical protein
MSSFVQVIERRQSQSEKTEEATDTKMPQQNNDEKLPSEWIVLVAFDHD